MPRGKTQAQIPASITVEKPRQSHRCGLAPASGTHDRSSDRDETSRKERNVLQNPERSRHWLRAEHQPPIARVPREPQPNRSATPRPAAPTPPSSGSDFRVLVSSMPASTDRIITDATYLQVRNSHRSFRKCFIDKLPLVGRHLRQREISIRELRIHLHIAQFRPADRRLI